MTLALLGFAVLTLLCLAGYRLERARAGRPSPRGPCLAVRAVGTEQWIRLGESVETSFDSASAEPTLASAGFRLRDEQGNTYDVPEGATVQIRQVDGARRVPLAAITEGGALRPRVSFDVPADAVLHALPPRAPLADVGYRAPPAGLVEPGEELVLAGTEAALRAGTPGSFPGCWLMILFPFVGGGLFLIAIGQRAFSLVALGVGLLLTLLGFSALPKKPKIESDPA